jgi:hypothetical protein
MEIQKIIFGEKTSLALSVFERFIIFKCGFAFHESRSLDKKY